MAADADEVPVPPGAARPLAVVALLLLMTSFWLPWWVVQYESDTLPSSQEEFFLFRPDDDYTTWAPIVTGIITVAAGGLMFVRVAGRSWEHEPHAWRRDLGVAGVVLGMAFLTTLWWPKAVPYFWGARAFHLQDASFTEEALPGLGWWCALASLVTVSLASVVTRGGAE